MTPEEFARSLFQVRLYYGWCYNPEDGNKTISFNRVKVEGNVIVMGLIYLTTKERKDA